MTYYKTVTLKDGRECVLRNGTEKDGAALLYIFNLTHGQTDFLLSYPDESAYTADEEAEFLKARTASEREIELLAEIGGQIVGSAGIGAAGQRRKVRHRAEFGISVDMAYRGLGVGRALTEACVECARAAGYSQLELEVVAENGRAVSLYEKCGFVEFGRNPRGFLSDIGKYQEVVHMRLELDRAE